MRESGSYPGVGTGELHDSIYKADTESEEGLKGKRGNSRSLPFFSCPIDPITVSRDMSESRIQSSSLLGPRIMELELFRRMASEAALDLVPNAGASVQ